MLPKGFYPFIIGEIGVEGARYCSMEFTDQESPLCRWMDGSLWLIWQWKLEQNGIMEADAITLSMLSNISLSRKPRIYHSDSDAEWKDVIEVNVASIELK